MTHYLDARMVDVAREALRIVEQREPVDAAVSARRHKRGASRPSPSMPPRLARVAADLVHVETLAPDSAWPLESAWAWIQEHGAADGGRLPARETWLRYAREVVKLLSPSS